MDIDEQKSTGPKLLNPEFMDALVRGEAIVVMDNITAAKQIVEQLNGAEIDNSTVKVEFFITAEDRKRCANSFGKNASSGANNDIAMGNDQPMSTNILDSLGDGTGKEKFSSELTSKKVKISGLSQNVTKVSLNTL